MSEQRNAERDRDMLAAMHSVDGMPMVDVWKALDAWPHWLERAVRAEAALIATGRIIDLAEQRVAELEQALRTIIDKCKGASAYTDAAYAHLYAFQALKGGTE